MDVITAKDIRELEAINNHTVHKIVAWFKRIEEGEHYGLYVGALTQLQTYADDLKNNPQRIKGNKNEKGFEQAMLVMKNIKELNENINYLRIQLSSENQVKGKREATTLFDKARVRQELNGESKI